MTTQDELATLRQKLGDQNYICDERIAVTLYLARSLDKPVFIEGPPGVGKTQLARSCAAALELPLIRLQCYEGLDETRALYEWKYGKQLLYTQMMKSSVDRILRHTDTLEEGLSRLHAQGDVFFSKPFLEPRPLLQSLESAAGCVLLIDEIDRADEAFEALLLEVLSDFQVSIPEIGTVRAVHKPMVFLTSNNVREMSDALKRRCLHLHIPFPDARLEAAIVRVHLPTIHDSLLTSLVAFIQQLRTLDLKKQPSVSETLDWARALILLGAEALDRQQVSDTLHIILKYQQDIERVTDELPSIHQRSLADTQALFG